MPIKFVFKEVKNDFEYELLNALEYQEWYAPDLFDYEILLIGGLDKISLRHFKEEWKDTEIWDGKYNLVPIGDLDFVREFTSKILERELKPPISVPDVLYKYLNRTIVMAEDMESEDVYYDILNEIKKRSNKNKAFIKNVSEYKKYNSVINIDDDIPKEVRENMDNRYMFSEYISNIESEFRIFVYQNEVVGCHNYLGDPLCFPNIYSIKEMVANYKNSPPAYTLDIAVTSDGTNKLLEIHPLISCGLYGLREYDKLPQMMARSYRWALEEA